MRILIITGKGGVGKTSVAAATAVKTSQLGKKTIVLSTDPAHSLSDSFDVKLGPEPVKVADNLYAQEIDSKRELEKNWGKIQNVIRENLNSRGIDSVLAEEVSIFPGMDELFSLLLVKEYYLQKKYEVIIIDCAPTGETIKHLSFPEVGKWYLKKIFPLQKLMTKVARPLAKKIYDVTLMDSSDFDSLKDLIQSLDGIKELLSDPDITSIRFVVNLEKMVIKEAQRAYSYMNIFGYPVDCIYVNKIFPDSIKDPYFSRWKSLHKKYLGEVKESFDPLPIFRINLFDHEVVGIDSLKMMADHIYGETDPLEVFCKVKTIEVIEENDTFFLKWKIPFVKKEEIDLYTRGDELVLNGQGYVRNIILPRILIGKSIVSAKYEDEFLKIKFGAEEE